MLAVLTPADEVVYPTISGVLDPLAVIVGVVIEHVD